MMNMFKDLGQIAGLLKNLPKMKEEMERFQASLAQITAEGDAGGGMVKVRVNGKFEMLGCTLSDDVMNLNDREMLEDLIRSATNLALEKVRRQVAEEAGRMGATMGLPPGMGMNLPGITE